MALAVTGSPSGSIGIPNYGLTPNTSADGNYVFSVELGDMVALPAYYEVASYNSASGATIPLSCGLVTAPGVLVNSAVGTQMTVTVTDSNGVVYNGTFTPPAPSA